MPSSRNAGRPWTAVLLAVLAGGPAQAQAPAAAAAPSYAERYRPQYHFSPAANWANDPNGMVHFDGEWHLFYQHNPFGPTWGHMSWGHAVSRDLVRWRHLPVAIPEAGGVMAYSGSAVVDSHNTSGFGRGGRPPLVAVYTGHRTDRPSESQYLAYSTDRGRTWTRHAGNPVLDLGTADFRDPKVFWYAPERKWVMVVALPAERKVRFYGSPDLKRWSLAGEFGPSGATGGAWECPDLFELPLEGDPRDPTGRRWVLVVNVNPGGVAGGSAGQYFVGRFDGTRFVADANGGGAPAADPTAALWLDHGKDFYAAVTWSDVPRSDGRRVLLGWMNNWQYANDVPTAPWRGAMSLPRALALVHTAAGPRLVQRPVRELERLRGAPRRLPARDVGEGSTSLAAEGVRGRALEIEATFALGPGVTAREFGLKVRAGPGEETIVGVDPAAGRLIVDRTRSGQTGLHKEFVANGRETAPLPAEGGRGAARVVRLRVFVDWSSVEVFAGDGRAVITDQIFPAPASDGVALYAAGGRARLVGLTAWPVGSAWSTGERAAARPGAPGRPRPTSAPDVAP